MRSRAGRRLHGWGGPQGGGALLLIVGLLAGGGQARAGERPGSHAWLVGLELQERDFDAMSVGDVGPLARGEPGVRGSVDWLLTPNWAVGISGHFGGTWLNWSDPVLNFNTAGKLERVAWSTRGGVDRVLGLGARGLAFVGVGIEYGEARSWLHTLGSQTATGRNDSQSISEEGPHAYMTGGYLRLGAMTPVWRRAALCAQLSQSYYHARALDPPFGTEYRWLGRSLALSVGLRFEVARGRSDRPR